jgi:hypothetical protein
MGFTRYARRNWAIGLIAGLGALVLVAAGIHLSSEPRDTRSGTLEALSVAPPEGMKYVGIGRAAIAVPETWKYRRTDCLVPRPGTFYFSNRPCRRASTPGSQVELGPASHWDKRVPRTELWIDGFRVVSSGVVCLESEPGVCLGRVSIPRLDAEFAVSVGQPDGGIELVAQMLNSVTVLPFAERGGRDTPRPTRGTYSR